MTDSIFGMLGIIFYMCLHTKFQDDLLNNIQNFPEKLLRFRCSRLKLILQDIQGPLSYFWTLDGAAYQDLQVHISLIVVG